MEKYAVETEKFENTEKLANNKKFCKSCGINLNDNSNVPHCISCGTAPYEIQAAMRMMT